MMPLNKEENMCLDCHTADGDAKPPTPSHYTDYRNAPDKVSEEIVGARYVCVSCHVEQSNAQPLVGNSLQSVTRP